MVSKDNGHISDNNKMTFTGATGFVRTAIPEVSRTTLRT